MLTTNWTLILVLHLFHWDLNNVELYLIWGVLLFSPTFLTWYANL